MVVSFFTDNLQRIRTIMRLVRKQERIFMQIFPGSMKRFILLVFTLTVGLHSFAQPKEETRKDRRELRRQRINAIIRQEEEGVIAYKKHTAFGFKLTSDGYGGFVEIARAKSVKKALLFQLEITERKHNKEYKQQNDSYFSLGSPLIYGKLNYFYPIKLGVQQQILLGNKGNKNGVSITANLGGGAIIGLLRPYMVEVDKNGERTFIEYSQADSTLFTDYNFIYGGPNFGKGWGKLKVTPGFYAKPSIRFDYGKYNELLSAIEVGLIAEYYTKKIPQMLFYKQDQMFFSAYVGLVFGRRK